MARVANASCEEVGECLAKIAQGLLLAGLGDSADPVESSAEVRQLPSLGNIVELLAGLAFEVLPPIAALLKREIVDQAAHARELPELSFMFGGSRQLERA